jgi:TRAP-type C4-dicarboxylate transport system permease small subunit
MNTRTITRTAILLALTILFQTLGRFIPLGQANQFIVGPLVNACLLVAAAFIGLGGGAVVSILSPFGAILTGAAIPLPFAPIIAVGNFILVLLYVIFMKKQVLGIASGAVLKFLFLWGGVSLFINLMNVPAKKAAALVASFSWPQLVTALAGGVIALIVIKALGRALKENA